MSTAKRQQKKRKYSSPAPLAKSRIAKRFERFRNVCRRDLWADDDDDDDNSSSQVYKQSKIKNSDTSFIVLSDSDEERSSRNAKRERKKMRNHKEKTMCLICSIMSRLSSHNCCSEHLSILTKHSDHQSPKSVTQWLPDKVMIVPLTDEIVQRYLEPQQIYHLRTPTTTTTPIHNRKTTERMKTTTKTTHKSTMTTENIDVELLDRSNEMYTEPLASSIVIESTPVSMTIETEKQSAATTTNDVLSNVQEDPPSKEILIEDPWSPIREEVDAALEHVLIQLESSEESPLEFTPTTARRTDTEVMAALLPKIPLKQGRFRNGRPTQNRTSLNAANEYRPSSIATRNSCQTDIVPTAAVDNNQPVTSTNNDNTAIETQESEFDQNVTSSTTPSRLSYRLNPDGTRVSISRPVLPTSRQSPRLNSLRRLSTDVTPIQSNAK